jgi:hypothetical protein
MLSSLGQAAEPGTDDRDWSLHADPFREWLEEVVIRSITTISAFACLRALAAASPAKPAPIITILFIHCPFCDSMADLY